MSFGKDRVERTALNSIQVIAPLPESLCGLAHCVYRLDCIAFPKGTSSIAFTVRKLHTQETHGNTTSHVQLLGYPDS